MTVSQPSIPGMPISRTAPTGRSLCKGKEILEYSQGNPVPARMVKINMQRPTRPTQECRRWSPLEINVDVVWHADAVGIARLIRYHLGRVHLAFTMALTHLCSPQHAETVAIREGLCQAEIFGYINCTFESDCKGVCDQFLARSGTLGSLEYSQANFLSYG